MKKQRREKEVRRSKERKKSHQKRDTIRMMRENQVKEL